MAELVSTLNRSLLTRRGGLRVIVENQFRFEMVKTLHAVFRALSADLRDRGIFRASVVRARMLRHSFASLKQRRLDAVEDIDEMLQPVLIDWQRSTQKRLFMRYHRMWSRVIYESGAVDALMGMGFQARSRLVDGVLRRSEVLKAADDVITFELTDGEIEAAMEGRTIGFGTGLTSEIVKDARTLLRDNVYFGTQGTHEIAGIIAEGAGIPEWRGLKIARTETQSTFNRATYETHRRSGVRKHSWLEVGDNRVRDWHRTNAASDPIEVGTPFPSGQLHPGDPGPMVQHINCRCSLMADLSDPNVMLEPWDGSSGPYFDSLPETPRMTYMPGAKPPKLTKAGLPEKYIPIRPNELETMGKYTDEAGFWSAERRLLHDDIVAKLVSEGTTVDDPVAYMMGGGPASGKSNLLKQGKVTLPKNKVTIDSDDIKKLIPEYQATAAAGDSTAAAVVHEESSYLAKRVMKESVSGKKNLMLDGTGDSSIEKLRGKVQVMRAKGHKVDAHYVTVDTDEAVRRSMARAEKTGRKVPEEFIRGCHETISEVLPKAVDEDLFDAVKLWDTNEGVPRLVMSREKGKAVVIHDEALWQRFLKKNPDYKPPAPVLKPKLPKKIKPPAVKKPSLSVKNNLRTHDKVYKKAKLDAVDRKALLRYTEDCDDPDCYGKVNKALREGKNLTQAQKKAVDGVDTALRKLRVHKGTTHRSVEIFDEKTLDKFVKSHKKGNIVTYNEYLSTSSEGGIMPGNVTLEIESKTGRRISKFSERPEEAEVLFGRGSSFIVEAVEKDILDLTDEGMGKISTYVIKLKEVDPPKSLFQSKLPVVKPKVKPSASPAEIQRRNYISFLESRGVRDTWDDFNTKELSEIAVDLGWVSTKKSVLVKKVNAPKVSPQVKSKPRTIDKKYTPSKLSKVDTKAIATYTDDCGKPDCYSALNRALRDGESLQKSQQLQVDRLDKALRKIPAHRGNVFRGMDLDEHELAIFLEQHTEGNVVTYNQYVSTSRNEAVAVESFEGNMLLRVKSKTGKDISKISARGDEAEVLFGRGSSFVVKNAELVRGARGVRWEVVIEEI